MKDTIILILILSFCFIQLTGCESYNSIENRCNEFSGQLERNATKANEGEAPPIEFRNQVMSACMERQNIFDLRPGEMSLISSLIVIAILFLVWMIGGGLILLPVLYALKFIGDFFKGALMFLGYMGIEVFMLKWAKDIGVQSDMLLPAFLASIPWLLLFTVVSVESVNDIFDWVDDFLSEYVWRHSPRTPSRHEGAPSDAEKELAMMYEDYGIYRAFSEKLGKGDGEADSTIKLAKRHFDMACSLLLGHYVSEATSDLSCVPKSERPNLDYSFPKSPEKARNHIRKYLDLCGSLTLSKRYALLSSTIFSVNVYMDSPHANLMPRDDEDGTEPFPLCLFRILHEYYVGHVKYRSMLDEYLSGMVSKKLKRKEDLFSKIETAQNKSKRNHNIPLYYLEAAYCYMIGCYGNVEWGMGEELIDKAEEYVRSKFSEEDLSQKKEKAESLIKALRHIDRCETITEVLLGRSGGCSNDSPLPLA